MDRSLVSCPWSRTPAQDGDQPIKGEEEGLRTQELKCIVARQKLQKVWELNAPQNTEVEAGSGTHGCKRKVVLQSHPSQLGAQSCSVAPHR